MKGNLLIVDDELALAEIMKELFEDDACTIFTAENGIDALAILEQECIDCIVSDIKMPTMDGITFFHEVKKIRESIPFIFFTGHGTEELNRSIRELGASDLLMKPNFDHLEMAIKKAMELTDLG